jgi:hypothetical protein
MGVKRGLTTRKGYSCSLELYDLLANDVIRVTS